ncbi:MAG: TlpA family protein disulfide reductase [Acidobacteria bacterium]|nr:TlpA family protein disulfide reductase [Acidobacteriota bacterium]
MGRFLIACSALLLWIGLGCQQSGSGSSLARPGTDVGRVALVDASGQRSSLADYRGRVVLIDIWATWCPPCRRSLPELAQLQRGSGPEAAVLAISVDEKGWEAVRPFLAERPELGLRAHLPADRKALEALGSIRGIPTSFVLDRQGRVRSSWVGYQEGRAARELAEALRTPAG